MQKDVRTFNIIEQKEVVKKVQATSPANAIKTWVAEKYKNKQKGKNNGKHTS